MADDRNSHSNRAATPLDKRPDRIAGMFDDIADRYDLLNTLLSCGLDRYWRWRAVNALGFTGRECLLDVCTGTADVAIAAAHRQTGAARVLGVDFSGAMLARGLRKVRSRGLAGRVQLVRGDAMRLPAADASMDGATIAFGIRNVLRPEHACTELARVLRPGGRVAILEFGLPQMPGVRGLYRWYFNRMLPRIGRMVSRHTTAYEYLPQSVGLFPWGEGFLRLLADAGFSQLRARPLALGVVYLYIGVKPVARSPML